MKIIFLDIDGVLNYYDYFESYYKETGKPRRLMDQIDIKKVKLLQEIVDATAADIVRSSTWRILRESDKSEESVMFTYLRNTLGEYGLKIMDYTPVIDMFRPEEIKTWVENKEKTGETVIFVSLDDDFTQDEYDAYEIGHCLVKTNYWKPDGGLRKEHVEKAIKILNGGM